MHAHVWGWHRLAPSRMPTATLIASSLSLRPQDVIGRACNQSLACLDDTAFNLAWLFFSGSVVNISASVRWSSGWSHLDCMWVWKMYVVFVSASDRHSALRASTCESRLSF